MFNVVKEQQMEINRQLVEVGPLERKREQVMKSIDKRAFLDVLMGGSKSIPIDDPVDCKKVEKIEDKVRFSIHLLPFFAPSITKCAIPFVLFLY